MDLGIHVPHTADGLQPYLEALGRGQWDGIELSGDALRDGGNWEDLLEAFELECLGVGDLLPESVTRYLPETTDAARNKLLAYLKNQLSRAAMLNIRYTTLDLGMDRIPVGQFNAERDRRLPMLRSLMALAEAHEITACLPVRLPVPPFNPRLFDQSVQLINEVMHPNCRLALNIVPEELPDDYDIRALLKAYCVHIALIRFHYEPALGIGFGIEQQEAWAKALRWQGFRGTVIFCPRVHSPEMFRDIAGQLGPTLNSCWRDLQPDR